MESQAEKLVREQQERRKLIHAAVDELGQASIDLMIVVAQGDSEKRNLSFWVGTAFVYAHKYTDRLRKYAQERKANVERKENEALFTKYIALTPPKTATELLTLMQRFGIAPQVPIPQAEAQAAVATQEKKSA